jgi:hypothetical protein
VGRAVVGNGRGPLFPRAFQANDMLANPGKHFYFTRPVLDNNWRAQDKRAEDAHFLCVPVPQNLNSRASFSGPHFCENAIIRARHRPPYDFLLMVPKFQLHWNKTSSARVFGPNLNGRFVRPVQWL